MTVNKRGAACGRCARGRAPEAVRPKRCARSGGGGGGHAHEPHRPRQKKNAGGTSRPPHAGAQQTPRHTPPPPPLPPPPAPPPPTPCAPPCHPQTPPHRTQRCVGGWPPRRPGAHTPATCGTRSTRAAAATAHRVAAPPPRRPRAAASRGAALSRAVGECSRAGRGPGGGGEQGAARKPPRRERNEASAATRRRATVGGEGGGWGWCRWARALRPVGTKIPARFFQHLSPHIHAPSASRHARPTVAGAGSGQPTPPHAGGTPQANGLARWRPTGKPSRAGGGRQVKIKIGRGTP